MAYADLCQRVRCGALSQEAAGPQALYECSRDGYVGVLGCSHPDCAPYLDEMRAAGVCTYQEAGRVAEVLPPHPAYQPERGEMPAAPVAVNLPRWEAPATPGVKRFNAPVSDPAWGRGRGMWCQAMAWVDANPCLAVGLVVAGWFVLRGRR
jgi:hypothetical protein